MGDLLQGFHIYFVSHHGHLLEDLKPWNLTLQQLWRGMEPGVLEFRRSGETVPDTDPINGDKKTNC